MYKAFREVTENVDRTECVLRQLIDTGYEFLMRNSTSSFLATPGSGYVLLHHVMGELEGIRGAWGYPEGGMGAVSDAIAKSAQEAGADIVVESPVKEVLFCLQNGPSFGKSQLLRVLSLANQNKNKMARKFKTFTL